MTGAVAIRTNLGSWTVIFDSMVDGLKWGTASWTGDEPEGTGLAVQLRASDSVADLPGVPFMPVTNGTSFSGVFGRHIEVQVLFSRDQDVEESPILYDLMIESLVEFVDLDLHPTSCPNPLNVQSKGVLPAAILGSEELDVLDIDVATIRLEGVVEPLRTNIDDVAAPVMDDGDPCECTTDGPDGYDDLTMKFHTWDVAAVIGSAEPGDVLVLTVTGNLLDGTPIEDSDCVVIAGRGTMTHQEEPARELVLHRVRPNPFSLGTRITYTLPGEELVRVAFYDVTGRLVADLKEATQSAGEHFVDWDAGDLSSGAYFVRVTAANQVRGQRITLSR
jgi:hypothetical protein